MPYSLELSDETEIGGEPEVVRHDKRTGEYAFYDCSPESPKGRRSICYDRTALEARKEHTPKESAIHMAAAMGVQILTEAIPRVADAGQFRYKKVELGENAF